MDTHDVNAALAALDPSSTQEDIAAAIGKVETLMREAKELQTQCDQIAMEWIAENGSIQIGPMRYWIAATKKVTKCKSVPQGLEIMLEVTGGDVSAIGECLASSAWKHGACKSVLGERWGEVFEVVEEPIINKEGKAEKRLTKCNVDFLNG